MEGRSVSLPTTRGASAPGHNWPLKDGLAMIKAGVIDEAIKEALSPLNQKPN